MNGYAGLGDAARQALSEAQCIVGGARRLALLPADLPGQHELWPSPFSLGRCWCDAVRRCVLAGGDPLFCRVGASLARQLPAEEPGCSRRLRRCPWPPPSAGLAAAGEVTVLSLVARPLAALQAQLFPARACWC